MQEKAEEATATAAAATATATATATAAPPPNPETKGIVGLQNMGATCYANATIQLLRCVPELSAYVMREDLESAIADKDNIYAKILLGYQDLIQSMWSAHRPAYVRPNGFLNCIREAVRGTVYENFGRPMQHDSHEYLVYLLDHFHEALNEKAGSKETVPDAPEGASMTTLASVGWSSFLARHRSPIVDIFFGMMRKTVECDTCHNKSYRWESFNVLKVPCRGATFHDWIRSECAIDTIDEYECLPCRKALDKRQPAKTYAHIWRLPSSLFIGLKRFNPDGSKDNTTVPYAGENMCFREHFAPESDHESKDWTYEIRGISDHHGGTGGGHYSAQVTHPVTNKWWWIDDSMSQSLEEGVMGRPGPRFGSPNYLFYFRRIMIA